MSGTKESKRIRQIRVRKKKQLNNLCIRCNYPINNHRPGCLKQHNSKNKLLYKQQKNIVFEIYGNSCNCCGEAIKDFLTIDHCNNNGNIERRSMGLRSLYNKLSKLPKSNDYQLLCWNCNCSKNAFGVCFHNYHEDDTSLSPQTRWYRKLKKQTIIEYGGKCVCCEESRLGFLTIDHINGGGRVERQKVGTGSRFYRWLKNNNFPSGYQVLCYNCNCSKGALGCCPHQSFIAPITVNNRG